MGIFNLPAHLESRTGSPGASGSCALSQAAPQTPWDTVGVMWEELGGTSAGWREEQPTSPEGPSTQRDAQQCLGFY